MSQDMHPESLGSDPKKKTGDRLQKEIVPVSQRQRSSKQCTRSDRTWKTSGASRTLHSHRVARDHLGCVGRGHNE